MTRKIGLLATIVGLFFGIFGYIGTVLHAFFNYGDWGTFYSGMLLLSIPICLTGVAIILYAYETKEN